MKDHLNSRIKHRESFRPFAPSVLEERAGEWFEMGGSSPFMLMTCQVKREQQSRVPAITHVDGTARQQTVSRSTNPKYWSLIHAFEKKTGVPVVLNTSFNENEPVVNTPEEGVACFSEERHGRAGVRTIPRGEEPVGAGLKACTTRVAVADAPERTRRLASTKTRRPLRVVFFNRSYYPDFGATGQLLTELCEDLVSRFGYDVTVVAGMPLSAEQRRSSPVLVRTGSSRRTQRREDPAGVGHVAADAKVHGPAVELPELLLVRGDRVASHRQARRDRVADRSADRVAHGHRAPPASPARDSCFSARTCFPRWRDCSRIFRTKESKPS